MSDSSASSVQPRGSYKRKMKEKYFKLMKKMARFEKALDFSDTESTNSKLAPLYFLLVHSCAIFFLNIGFQA